MLCFTNLLFDKIDGVQHQQKINCAQVKEKIGVDFKDSTVILENSMHSLLSNCPTSTE